MGSYSCTGNSVTHAGNAGERTGQDKERKNRKEGLVVTEKEVTSFPQEGK